MLKYFSNYSVGGYKDFYLGSSADKFESSYYFSLLPVWEERAQTNNDQQLRSRVAELRKLPPIKVISTDDSFGLPPQYFTLSSHGGYKLIYEHLEGDNFALVIRDIANESKDETGRCIPFLFTVICDSQDDLGAMNIMAAYASSNICEASSAIASTLSYDAEKNGLRFDVSRLNEWIARLVRDRKSSIIQTIEAPVQIRGKKGEVSLLLLPDGIPQSLVVKELDLLDKPVCTVKVSEILPSDRDEAIERIRSYYHTEMEHQRIDENNRIRRDRIIATVGGGLLTGLLVYFIMSCGSSSGQIE